MLHKKTELFLPHLPASSVLSATVVGEKISDLQSPIVLTFTTNENVGYNQKLYMCRTRQNGRHFADNLLKLVFYKIWYPFYWNLSEICFDESKQQ